MRNRTVKFVLGGLAAAALVAAGDGLWNPAHAARRGKNRGASVLRLASISVAGQTGVPLNAVIEMRFTGGIRRQSVDPSIFRIRAQNANGTGFTRQVAGDFQHAGDVVRFFPRLPTHLRDADDPRNGFHPLGSALDDAEDNAGLQPGLTYEVRIIGNPSPSAVRSRRGRPLARTYAARFSTSPATVRSDLYTTKTYVDTPPPQLRYSNPSDRIASLADQYAFTGGSRQVPSDIAIALFGSRVPLSPSTVRREGNVTLTMTSRQGDPSVRQTVDGAPFLEQSFETTRLVYQPRFPLPDESVFALRVTKDVTDLTEEFALAPNAGRARLREIYDYLSAARTHTAAQTGTDPDPAILPDPPLELIANWPQGPGNAQARGVLKRAILDLGDTSPDEIDPRVMLVFTTRNEPVSEGRLIFEFERDDGLLDPNNTIADWDGSVPGAVSAVFTLGGGDGSDGDFVPEADVTISSDAYEDGQVNWRRMRIPAGVTVNVTGSRPLQMNALDLTLDGELRADGQAGENADTGTYAAGTTTTQRQRRGGAGGPGGGRGGSSSTDFFVGNSTGRGEAGERGVGFAGVTLTDADAGHPGQGGTMEVATDWRWGAAGGGGGGRQPGTRGSDSTANNNVGWSNGKGGDGGAGSANDDLQPLAGAAGGGAGGNTIRLQGVNWSKTAGAGGGGGGALQIQTSGLFRIGPTGRIRARGGRGGNGTNATSTMSAGPGGGGGGGSILLRSVRGFQVADPASTFDVSGGAGGTQTGIYTAPSGGNGGSGHLRLESPDGGLAVPGGTSGPFDPAGGGAPSVAYTLWTELGVLDPHVVNPVTADFDLDPATNDAVLIEAQFALDDPARPGTPLLDALGDGQVSTDTDQVSDWLPLRVVDRTGRVGGAFPGLAGYDPRRDGLAHTFAYADRVNGRGYGHVRLRVTFQLDDSQTLDDALPYVDRIVLRYQFNL